MSLPTAPILRTHPLTGEPIHPVGHRRNGEPIWPIMGGAPDDPPAGGGQPTGQPPAGDPPPAGGAGDQPPAGGVDLASLTAEQLKDAPAFQTELNRVVGERLKKEQEKWQSKLEQERERASLDEAGKAAAALEDERKRAEEANAGRTAAFELVARTKAEVLAIAEGGRPDRTAAIVAQADLTGAIDDDGTVSEGVLRAAVVKVLSQFPEWKADATQQPPTTTPPGTPSRSGGELPPKGGGTTPTFTQSQLEGMSAEERVARWEEIEQAMEAGTIVYGR